MKFEKINNLISNLNLNLQQTIYILHLLINLNKKLFIFLMLSTNAKQKITCSKNFVKINNPKLGHFL